MRSRVEPNVVFTIGHSTRTAEELKDALLAWGVRVVVDVRTVPRSRKNPQFNKEVLPAAVAPLAYVHLAGLGGLRGRAKVVTDRNAGWQNASFRNYADYAETPAFRAALDELLALARREPVAVMCAEAVWWRCHRRIIADHLLARGVRVRHIIDARKAEDATMTPFARVGEGGVISYPPRTVRLPAAATH